MTQNNTICVYIYLCRVDTKIMFPAFKNVLVPDYSLPIPPPPPVPVPPIIIQQQARRTNRSRRLSLSHRRRRTAFFRRMADENRPRPVPGLSAPSGGGPSTPPPAPMPTPISQMSTQPGPPTPISFMTTQPGVYTPSSGQTTQSERFTPEPSTQIHIPPTMRPLNFNPFVQMPAVGQRFPSNSVARSLGLSGDASYYSSPEHSIFSIPPRKAVHPDLMDETPERIVVTGKHGRSISQFIIPETPLSRPAKRLKRFKMKPQKYRRQYESNILNQAWSDFLDDSYSTPGRGHVEEIDSD